MAKPPAVKPPKPLTPLQLDELVRCTFSLDRRTDQRIDRLAAKLGISRSVLIRASVKAVEDQTVPPYASITLDYGPDPEPLVPPQKRREHL